MKLAESQSQDVTKLWSEKLRLSFISPKRDITANVPLIGNLFAVPVNVGNVHSCGGTGIAFRSTALYL
jgi:hypothetical protein